MRFRFIDQITQLTPGQRIEGIKRLMATERYLEDHFPRFPIMPGVLMLESMYQAAQWLVRRTEDFAHSMIVLKEARNVKFTGFVKPGQELLVTAEIKKQEGNCTTLMTQGTVDGRLAVSARLIVETFQIGDRFPHRAATQDYILREVRKQFEHVMAGTSDEPPGAGLSMRWLLIDRMVEFVRGERAMAIKNVSLAEESLSDYVPGFPMLPCSLIVEGLAWTGGLLANDQRGFQERTVLAKLNRAVFHRPALPGDQLRYTAVLEAIEAEGAFIRGTSHVGDELQAEVYLFLAHLGNRFQDVEGDLVSPADMLMTLRIFGVYDVGRLPSGSPLDVPAKLLDAERDTAAQP